MLRICSPIPQHPFFDIRTDSGTNDWLCSASTIHFLKTLTLRKATHDQTLRSEFYFFNTEPSSWWQIWLRKQMVSSKNRCNVPACIDTTDIRTEKTTLKKPNIPVHEGSVWGLYYIQDTQKGLTNVIQWARQSTLVREAHPFYEEVKRYVDEQKRLPKRWLLTL